MVATDAPEVKDAPCELKRPVSSYWLWLGENRAEIVKALDGNAKGSLVAKKAGEMWKALAEAEKAPFEERAKKLKEEYLAKMPAKIAKEKQATEVPGRKKPMTAVFAFIQEKRVEIQGMDGIKTLGDISKKGAVMYTELPEEDKNARKAKYEAELKEYKEWAETDEGKACLDQRKEMKKDKISKKGKSKKALAAEAKADAKAAKDAEKQKVKDDKTAEKAAKSADKTAAKAAGKMATASAKKAAAKRKADKTAPKPKAKAARTSKGRKPAVPAPPTIDAAVLKKCEKLGNADNGVEYKKLLEKLMVSDGIKGKFSDADGLAALQKSGGLVNKARNSLKA